jgi:hypothetical protein
MRYRDEKPRKQDLEALLFWSSRITRAGAETHEHEVRGVGLKREIRIRELGSRKEETSSGF